MDPDALYLDTVRWEGKIPWLYRDTRGMATAGVGFYIPNEAALKQYNWDSLSEAVADHRALMELPSGKPAEWYRPYTHARLSDDAIHEAFDRIAKGMIRGLEKGWLFSRQPIPVQRALFDMSWNVGLKGLDLYVKLHAAVLTRDWEAAARQCGRKGPGAARNEWTRNLFLSMLP